jgi:biotin carboxyl carrier protein
VLAEQRGCIAFMASTHLGIPPFLNFYNTELYKNSGRALYGNALGNIIKRGLETLGSNPASLNYYQRIHLEEINLHGDPAIRINSFSAPDYTVEEQHVKISPTIISVADNCFNLNVVTYNIGRAVNDSMRTVITLKLANDSVNFKRYKELYDRNATTRIEYERAELAFQTSKNDVSARRKAWLRTKNQLYVDLQNSKSNFKVNAREEDNYRIKSFEAGKLYEIYKKQGELVRRGEAIALVGDANEVYAQLAIDESDFVKVQIGQTVLVKIDVYKDKIFKAKVTKLFPKLNKADQTFRVDAEFMEKKPNAYYGMTIEANIVVSESLRVLTIPKNYLVGRDSVWIEENGDKKKIKITKGVENLDMVEVKAGLTDKSILMLGN